MDPHWVIYAIPGVSVILITDADIAIWYTYTNTVNCMEGNMFCVVFVNCWHIDIIKSQAIILVGFPLGLYFSLVRLVFASADKIRKFRNYVCCKTLSAKSIKQCKSKLVFTLLVLQISPNGWFDFGSRRLDLKTGIYEDVNKNDGIWSLCEPLAFPSNWFADSSIKGAL